jgi:hypothetical protein
MIRLLHEQKTKALKITDPFPDRLTEFFEQFRRLEAIHAQLESTYSTTILIVILCKLTSGTVKTYVLIRFLSNTSGRLNIFNFVFDGEEKKADVNPEEMYRCVLELVFTLLGIALNFVWTTGFVLSLVYCNDMVRC